MTAHHHHHDPKDSHHTGSTLSYAFVLNLIFTVIEIVGGLLTNSIAILSDAVHDLGDTATIGFSWLMEKTAEKHRTDELTYGYKRFSLLGAMVSSLVLLFGSVYILSKAIPRLMYPEAVKPGGMLVLAVLGIAVNGMAVLRLKRGSKINERIIFLHLLEDVLGWTAVLAISVILLFVDMPILDPILSIAITVFILSKIIPNVRQILKIFLQYSPEDIDIRAIKQLIEGNDHIESAHDIHLWSLDGHFTVLSCHISINENLSLLEIEKEKAMLKKQLETIGIAHATLECEPSSKICSDCDL